MCNKMATTSCLPLPLTRECFVVRSIVLIFPPEDMFIDFTERGGEGGERKRERGRETSIGERNIRNMDWLPPLSSLTRDQTHNILVSGMTFQPTEPLGQGYTNKQTKKKKKKKTQKKRKEER